jgi:hypothetical protein
MVMPMLEYQTTIAVLQCVMIVKHAPVRKPGRNNHGHRRIGTD